MSALVCGMAFYAWLLAIYLSISRPNEKRIREIIREEDFYAVNRRYPSWAKNVPVAPDAAARTDRLPEHLSDFGPEQGGVS